MVYQLEYVKLAFGFVVSLWASFDSLEMVLRPLAVVEMIHSSYQLHLIGKEGVIINDLCYSELLDENVVVRVSQI